MLLKKYQSIINSLMSNDHNGSYNEILPEIQNEFFPEAPELLQLAEAIAILIEALENTMQEYELEDEGIKFYQLQLNRSLQLKEEIALC